MQTTEEQLQDLLDTIRNFESHIQEAKVTPATLTKAQGYLDNLEKHYPPKDRSTDSRILFHMYELQALIDTAKGNVRRAKAFIGEARDLRTGEDFVSDAVQALGGPNSGKGTKINFFVVSGWRLLIMSVLTLGLYEVYWFYKNWKAVEAATGRKQHAVLSAIFAPLFSYNLFLEVKKAADDTNYDRDFSPGWRAVGYFFFGLLAMFGVQRVMRHAGAKNHESFSTGETIFLVIGLLYWGLLIFSGIMSSGSAASDRRAFVDSCTSEAARSATFGSAEASRYCGCVYDTGLERFGKDEFLNKATAIETSSGLSNEMSTLINDCLSEVQSI